MADFYWKNEVSEFRYNGSEAALLGAIFLIGASYTATQVINTRFHASACNYLKAPNNLYLTNRKEKRTEGNL